MNFWEAERRARRITTIYIVLFILLALGVAVVSEYMMRKLAQNSYDTPLPLIAIASLLITFLVAGFNLLMYRNQGGSYVSESLGAHLVDPHTINPSEKQLLNIVEEMSVASSMPMPKVYILPSKEINAFAAGLNPDDASITVTQGAMRLLNRDELQGVIGHEFGHIANGDMKIGLKVAALVMGFYCIFILGMRTLQISSYRRQSNNRQIDPLFLAGIILLIGGLISWFAGTLLRFAISRQRELLADASSVQYTRSTDGLVNALRKILNEQRHDDMPINGAPYTHLYLDHRTSWDILYATHPPLERRIELLTGQKESKKKFE